MNRWEDLSEEDRKRIAREWTGEVREHRLMDPGTLAFVDSAPPRLQMPIFPRLEGGPPEPRRLVMIVAPDVMRALELLGMKSPSAAVH